LETANQRRRKKAQFEEGKRSNTMDICICRGLVVLFLNTPKKKKNTSEQKTTKRCTAIQDKKKIE
jgi:hypothetical protein